MEKLSHVEEVLLLICRSHFHRTLKTKNTKKMTVPKTEPCRTPLVTSHQPAVPSVTTSPPASCSPITLCLHLSVFVHVTVPIQPSHYSLVNAEKAHQKRDATHLFCFLSFFPNISSCCQKWCTGSSSDTRR